METLRVNLPPYVSANGGGMESVGCAHVGPVKPLLNGKWLKWMYVHFVKVKHGIVRLTAEVFCMYEI